MELVVEGELLALLGNRVVGNQLLIYRLLDSQVHLILINKIRSPNHYYQCDHQSLRRLINAFDWLCYQMVLKDKQLEN